MQHVTVMKNSQRKVIVWTFSTLTVAHLEVEIAG